ncbi:hypothetical protein G4G28_12365 [Massilia sp. Dwa41.01b]|uniref:hypothetical protein n=1 Tax=Massilia sp. Dwa41.01b TaxID=2709302 RepID=UPI0016003206|nr:hypothetical protein [Massilia sp. Dwa41.01b]QNA89071.1 hypothetical protein G4G28_12365 [Massilia sp. Dwa41.01b]
MKESVILATGDAAACALGYAASDARITGLALLEPEWDAASPGAAPASKPPYSAADRLFRRAAAFRHAATRARAPAEPAPPAASVLDGALRDYEGQVLVVGSSAPAGEPARARTRHVELTGSELRLRRSAWRDAVAFACASWLTSW